MKTKAEIFSNVKQTLSTAKIGLEDLEGNQADRKLSGLRNLAVFGRSVTNVLQQLRSVEPNFDEWYSEFVKEMKGDPLLKYFYKIRSEILKEGVLKTGYSLHINNFDSSNMEKIGIPPPNAKSFFIGDEIGGVGWIVELPDGTKEKYYGKLPKEVGELSHFFPENLNQHLGIELDKKPIEELGQLYFDYLKNLVDSAIRKFDIST